MPADSISHVFLHQSYIFRFQIQMFVSTSLDGTRSQVITHPNMIRLGMHSEWMPAPRRGIWQTMRDKQQLPMAWPNNFSKLNDLRWLGSLSIWHAGAHMGCASHWMAAFGPPHGNLAEHDLDIWYLGWWMKNFGNAIERYSEEVKETSQYGGV